MSQVIVTNDSLKDKREASRRQEQGIDREQVVSRWRRNDITGKDPIAAAVGYAVMPIVALWGFITATMMLVLAVVKAVFKGMGKIVGGTRSLITGAPIKSDRP